MKTHLIICMGLSIMVLTSCGKDKFQTKPTLEIKSISTKEVPVPNGTMTIRLTFTDKEGDLGNGTLTYIRIRTNGIPISDPNNNDKIDTIRTPVPNFPSKNTGEMDVFFDYNFLNEDPIRNDTMYFKFSVEDRGGNTSDTISSPLIVARQI
ncbi:MAG TPA: hypothetical protein VFZ42_12330 [Chitinophagaceae bacterium]